MFTKNLLEVSEKTKTVFPNLSSKMGVFCVMLAVFAGSAVWALDAPHGPVVLKVSGLIEAHNQGKVAVLDMKALQALPQPFVQFAPDTRRLRHPEVCFPAQQVRPEPVHHLCNAAPA